MTQRRHITLVAAGATILAALPLATVFERWTWIVGVIITVGLMTGVAVLLRTVRAPMWAPTVGMFVTYAVALTLIFGNNALLGVIPTPATFTGFNSLLEEAGIAIRDSGVPVDDERGLLFLAAFGIGAVLISVDIAAVVARRPAIAGLPMVAIYIVAVGTNSESVNFLSFIATAAAFLWLLATDNVDRVRRFGRRFTGDGRDVDVWEPSPLAAAGRRLAVIGVIGAVLLPMALPGMTTGLLDRFGSGVGTGGNGPGNGGGGRSGQVNLFSILSGTLERDKIYNMIKVTTNDPAPFYVRFGVAEDLRANGFVNRAWGTGTPLNDLKPLPAAPAGVKNLNFHAAVEIITFDASFLPIFETPTKVEGLDARQWQFDRRSNVLYSTRTSSKNKRYEFDYTRQEFTPEALRTAAALPENSPQQAFRTLPQPELGPVKEKAAELTAGKTNQYDKVRAIFEYFTNGKNGFEYTTQTTAGNSGSAIVDFLTNKKGYCEQYAAAMGWLVRAAGFPARVAFGFTRGNSTNTGTYTLQNKNLHAWTEVYFEGFGWVPFDATPASFVEGTVPSAWAPDPNQASQPATAPGENGAAGPAPGPSGSAATGDQRFGEGDDGAATTTPEQLQEKSNWLVYVLIAVAVALIVLVLPAVRRAIDRRRRWRSAAATVGSPSAARVDSGGIEVSGTPGRRSRREAHAAWDELIDTMIDYRVPVDATETPRVTAARLIRERSLATTAADGATLLGRAEERARYAREPLTGTDLAPALREVRSALRGRVSTRTRLMATFFPPSVIMRWRARTSTGYTSAVNAVAVRRDAALRTVNPRRLLSRRPADKRPGSR
ncbi:transglutaminase [Virgisporangium aliadipatigenens]|uniref:Transglutaminase n=1 Tax=Virgisporangium aliadipatigenens TaxID=741659 RepID=A0A8J3YU36_9ACTN|nr:DUF3488 and transglutaminase-like domain-containing protein [Virgisporangium aliadipatigenens]GIJ49895.1 transglutaminase [Virgisporangium aliadipatigenens]